MSGGPGGQAEADSGHLAAARQRASAAAQCCSERGELIYPAASFFRFLASAAKNRKKEAAAGNGDSIHSSRIVETIAPTKTIRVSPKARGLSVRVPRCAFRTARMLDPG
jgi:hypothetical protein